MHAVKRSLIDNDCTQPYGLSLRMVPHLWRKMQLEYPHEFSLLLSSLQSVFSISAKPENQKQGHMHNDCASRNARSTKLHACVDSENMSTISPVFFALVKLHDNLLCSALSVEESWPEDDQPVAVDSCCNVLCLSFSLAGKSHEPAW